MDDNSQRSFVSVSPFRCRMWGQHMRTEGDITEESCSEELESFRKHGQLVPVLGRPLHGDPDHDVELIYGARRLFVARHLNKPLLVELRPVSDREAIIAMDVENRQRVDISPYERGLSFARWLRSGIFRTQDELARELKVSGSLVSRLLMIARLPSAILCAFGRPSDICETWGIELTSALDDPQRRQQTLATARRISAMNPKPPAREVYRRLRMACVRGRRIPPAAHDEVVSDDTGAPLFRIRQKRDSIAVLLSSDYVSVRMLEQIRSALRDILQSENTQGLETGDLSALQAPLRRHLVSEASFSAQS